MQSRKPVTRDNFIESLKYNGWKETLSLPDVIYLANENRAIMIENKSSYHYHRVDTTLNNYHRTVVEIEVVWDEFDRFLQLINEDDVLILPLELL